MVLTGEVLFQLEGVGHSGGTSTDQEPGCRGGGRFPTAEGDKNSGRFHMTR